MLLWHRVILLVPYVLLELGKCHLDIMIIFWDALGLTQNRAFMEHLFKDVRANCFCASLLRTQMHTPRHTRARALSNKMRNGRAKGHCYSFAWI